MRPKNLKSKIFLDGGDPGETKEALALLGFVDGQTTNPSLIAKNPEAKERIDRGDKFSNEEILHFYKDVVKNLSAMIPGGSISIEVYADNATSAGDMFNQAKEMFTWIPNAHIKYPTNTAGLEAAERSVKEGMRVNMTLVFQQEQAAAVYSATRGAKKGDVFLSPFVGRLDDRSENGMGFIANVIKMYGSGDGHVEVLTASVRTYDHMLYALQLGSDIITAPFKVLKEWGEKGMPVPGDEYRYDANGLTEVPYLELDLNRNWREFNIAHDLTDTGIVKFADDWNSLIK
ncbi:MAG: transaldolase [Nitrospira bacterium SG8_35_4]|nr:MAG: transaldolase [Nitrospira bacterium SG8_35_4]